MNSFDLRCEDVTFRYKRMCYTFVLLHLATRTVAIHACIACYTRAHPCYYICHTFLSLQCVCHTLARHVWNTCDTRKSFKYWVICTIHSYTITYSSCLSLQKTRVTLRALRKFEDNSHVRLVQQEKHTAHERLLMS